MSNKGHHHHHHHHHNHGDNIVDLNDLESFSFIHKVLSSII
jgi:hypothetical protein